MPRFLCFKRTDSASNESLIFSYFKYAKSFRRTAISTLDDSKTSNVHLDNVQNPRLGKPLADLARNINYNIMMDCLPVSWNWILCVRWVCLPNKPPFTSNTHHRFSQNKSLKPLIRCWMNIKFNSIRCCLFIFDFIDLMGRNGSRIL